MTLKEINRRIQREEPHVELVRGEGYHYYTFTREADDKHDMIYESESVMVMHTSHVDAQTWITDGIEFGQRTRGAWGVRLT